MAGIGWVLPLGRNYEISLKLSWWKPWDKIEIRRSFYFNRLALKRSSEVALSYIIAFICINLEFMIYGNGGIYD